MQLLNFSMPPFARIVYASKDIKEKWEPRVNKAAQAYSNLERETVVHGLRSCHTEHIQQQHMMPHLQALAKKGLTFVPIQAVGSYSGFSHYHPPVIEGKPWAWYGAVGNTPESAWEFADASSATYESTGKSIDHRRIGNLLGYPTCCQDFFDKEWRAGFIDPVWQEAENCKPENVKKRSEHHIRLKSTIPYETSVMLRYIGVRILPHIPCSHDCQHSVKMAKDWVQLGRDLKLEGLDYLLEILQFPIEWDCLKGMAYVSTPIFKVETNSMTCYPKHVVQKEGTVYPEEAPKGLKFPWNESWKFQGIGGKKC